MCFGCIFNLILLYRTQLFVSQVRNKFLETYKVGAVYWPTVQTVAFVSYADYTLFNNNVPLFHAIFSTCLEFSDQFYIRSNSQPSGLHEFFQYDLERIFGIRKASEKETAIG